MNAGICIFYEVTLFWGFIGRGNLINTKKTFHIDDMKGFLCKDYKKDIFGRFAYDFELSQNILSFLI